MPLDDTHNQLSLSLCMEALFELRGANGLKFENFASKVEYREAIVKEISLLVAPDLLDDISDVIGNERLCKVLDGMFVEDTLEDSKLCGTYKLGLYGMGGLGKTTVSRALCMFYHKRFNGRVFHVELGSRPALDLQKLVLTKLLRINKNVVEQVQTVHEGRKLLKDHMKRQPVFLVIDNITNDRKSHIEALAYLEVGFHLGSRIMITSRSLEIVEELFPSHSNSRYSKMMAYLSEDEARLIFLQRAAPQRLLETLTIQEHEVLNKCLGQCCFTFTYRRRQYHPLALQAMADYYHKLDHLNVLTWKDHLGDLDKLRLSNASSDVFGILGLQFGTLAFKEKLMFLDLCLYSNDQFASHFPRDALSWLEDIHEVTSTSAKFQLQSLKRSGMIINIFDNEAEGLRIIIHDLYKEFAKWYVLDREGSHWCVYYIVPKSSTLGRKELGCAFQTMSIDSLPYVLKRTCPLVYEVLRIRLENLKHVSFLSKKLPMWCNVVVLQLYDCSNLRMLDLYGLTCLWHLELVRLYELESFHFVEVHPHSAMETNDMFESLQHVVLRSLSSLKQLLDFSLCILLKTFHMSDCEKIFLEPVSFMGCSQFEYSNSDWNGQRLMKELELHTLKSLTSLQICNIVVLEICACTNLKVLDLYGLNCLRHLELEYLPQLESFHFAKFQPHSMVGTNDRLESLLHVYLRGLSSLKRLPDFSLYTLLMTFRMLDCEEFLLEPPRLMGCSQLQDLYLDWNGQWRVEEFKLDTFTSLTSLQLCNQVCLSKWSRGFTLKTRGSLSLIGLDNCSQLKNLKLVAFPITSLQGLEKLINLEELHVSHCEFLQYIPNISTLAKLKSFTMVIGPNQQFPREDTLLQLRYLGCHVVNGTPFGSKSFF